ncbi:MAG: MCE family protein [Rhodococcus sp. (in: high G+C Gram-positive bacteria)]|uniref:MCE family protein n=1 Tax=Rhodococcus sp. TaxID=1831 RepID=UPI003BAFF68B
MIRKSVWVPLVLLAGIAVASFAIVPGTNNTTVHVEFTSTAGLYVGDEVRVMGVRVGSVETIEPRGESVDVTLSLDGDRKIPADAKAAIVSQSLVSARFIQLAPAYTDGDTLADGDSIPLDRTAVPVEWDEIKEQLSTLVTTLGPNQAHANGVVGDVVGAAAANLDGQGATLNRTLTDLSTAMEALSDGRSNLFDTIRNLHVFVSALASSGEQIVQFNGRLAAVGDVLAANSDDLAAALGNLDRAVGDIESFVRDNRDELRESMTSLSRTVEVLASRRNDLEQVLHVSPTALANLQNIYQPAQNAATSAVALSNFANPANFICSAIGGAAQVGAEEAARLCAQHLGPLLALLTTDYPGIRVNPVHGVGALPGQIEYSEPDLAALLTPGGVR